jgi:hypothetical protein
LQRCAGKPGARGRASGRRRRVVEGVVAQDTLAPTTLACMHGSAWRGDGSALLRALADSLEGSLAVAAAA